MTDQHRSPRAGTDALAPPVHIKDLHVRYGKDDPFILEGVDLDLDGGEVVALLGSSGPGKSTLMKAITGFAPVSAGQVRTAGFDVGTLPKRHHRQLRASVGHVFQNFNLIGRLPVLTNVLCGALHRAGPINLLGTFTSTDRTQALSLLERVRIANKADVLARTLSGGQQQRVAVARALMQNPKVIVADEPVASLDPKMSNTVLSLLRSIATDDSIPVLISMHDPALALAHADRIVGLHRGRVQLNARAADLTVARVSGLYDEPAKAGIA